jgi:hypothetical protein
MIIVIFIFAFIVCILLCAICPHWNQEQEQHKNKRPHDKKYTAHSKEKQLNHDVTFKKARRNTYKKLIIMLYVNSAKNI